MFHGGATTSGKLRVHYGHMFLLVDNNPSGELVGVRQDCSPLPSLRLSPACRGGGHISIQTSFSSILPMCSRLITDIRPPSHEAKQSFTCRWYVCKPTCNSFSRRRGSSLDKIWEGYPGCRAANCGRNSIRLPDCFFKEPSQSAVQSHHISQQMPQRLEGFLHRSEPSQQ